MQYDFCMEKTIKIRIGTRGSNLALAQANMVRTMLEDSNKNITAEIVIIKTTGDKILETSLAEIGGKGLFIKEIEERLLDGSIDIAVHSMKDMTAFIDENLEIACMLKREDTRDALVSLTAKNIADLKNGAVVGTSSPRRASQALNLRPDLKIVPFRGNIQTRLEKLKKNEVDATFLAIAGINRCKIDDNSINIIDENQMLPAVAQGAIGVEIKKDRADLYELLKPLNHAETVICVNMERAFLKEFEGSCKTPVAASAKLKNGKLEADFLIASIDGKTIYKTSKTSSIELAEKTASEAAQQLLAKAGENFFGG